MTVKIASVGININGVHNIPFCSQESLSAYDIVIFRPSLNNAEQNDTELFLEYYYNHWLTELDIVQNNGGLVFVLLPVNTHVDSSSGRTVNLADAIRYLPDKRTSVGKDIKVISNVFDGCFSELKQIFPNIKYNYIFHSIIAGDKLLLANKANGIVAFYRHNNLTKCAGHLIVCQELYDTISAEEAKQTDARFVNWLIRLHKFLYPADCNVELPPHWVEDESYKTAKELDCENKIRECELKMSELEILKNNFNIQANDAGKLKYLLFAQDKQLEQAVNLALNILGVQSEEYDNTKDTLQIDSKFIYNNLTVLGESKGHDGYANNDDINQLIGNRGQFYSIESKDDEDVPIGVLFINSERKKEPVDRSRTKCCSPKALKLSISNGIRIVWTPDLFKVAKYVSDTDDKDFATQCLNKIVQTDSGLIDFPDLPNTKL